MAFFKYTVTTSSGQRIEGEKESPTKEDLVSYLQSQSFTIISITENIGFNLDKVFQSDVGGLPLNDKVVLLKQLATMVGANIPIIQAIDILIQQTEKKSLKAKLQNIYKSIEAGTSLAEAFQKESGILSDVHLNLLAAGEQSANLNEMLEKIAQDLEKTKSLRGKITGALIYPAIIFGAIIVVVFLMLTVMIPQVKDLYLSLGSTELPPVTQFMVVLGESLNNPVSIIILIIVLISLFALYKYAYTTAKGAEFFDRVKLRIPIFGQLIQKSEVAQFCRLVAMLQKSGIQIIEAIEIVGNASGNRIFKNIVLNAKQEVIKGSTISLALAKYNEKKAFPVVLIRIISTGEESGKLDKILEDMSKFYEGEVQQLADNLTKLMEPLIMVIAGGLVGFLAIAVYLPIFQVGQLVN
jgi:type IV pilus assembly protein PilC